MTSINEEVHFKISFQRQMSANINQDEFTATFNTDFYIEYLDHFSEQCFVEQDYERDAIKGYMIGKDEGRAEDEYHIHVSAVTVAPEYRKLQVGTRLMDKLEQVGNAYKCKFCDLFVRDDNKHANLMYEKLNYQIFRTVVKYYINNDAYDRRKCLLADKEEKSLKNKGKSIKQWIDYQF